MLLGVKSDQIRHYLRMNDDQLLQFSRHIMLPDFDVAGQERLLQSKVLLIGAGGLGSPIALYLGAAGVGELTIVDDDQIDSRICSVNAQPHEHRC